MKASAVVHQYPCVVQDKVNDFHEDRAWNMLPCTCSGEEC